MAETNLKTPELLELGPAFRRAYTAALFIGGAGVAGAIVYAVLFDPTFRRFNHSYLVSYMFLLSISLGALLFVLVQHLTRAGWSVSVRRVAETLACMLPMLAVLAAPIAVSVIAGKGDLYPWARPLSAFEHAPSASHDVAAESAAEGHGPKHDPEIMLKKRAYLNPGFFVVRLAGYLAIWSLLGVYYWKWSVEQDLSRNVALSARMQGLAPVALLVTMLTLTFAAFDLLMSLDPAWFSTMFGVYYFAGSAVSIFATLIIIVSILHGSGYLLHTVTTEHFHDLGKFLFAFTFFWGYIAYSQFMLLWYGAIPEELGWLKARGATSVSSDINGWTYLAIALLVGHLFLPFAGLLSRHVKRRHGVLIFWAIWILVFHWLDLFWIVMPQYDGHFHIGLMDVLILVGTSSLFIAALLRVALRHNLRPVGDPRLVESLAFHNI